jgi:hypothetical protein
MVLITVPDGRDPRTGDTPGQVSFFLPGCHPDVRQRRLSR